MMLADISSVTPNALFTFLGCAAFIVGLVNGISKMVDRWRGKAPYPPNDQLHQRIKVVEDDLRELNQTIVGKEWFENVERDIAEIKKDFKEERDGTEKHVSMRASKIYEKIDEVTTALREEMQMQSDRRDQQISNLNNKMDAMPERLLNMLKNIRDLRT